MGMTPRRFVFEQAPTLEVVGQQLREHTGLDMTVAIHEHRPSPGMPYTSAALVQLSTGESLELFRGEQQIGVEYLPSLGREKYLACASEVLIQRLSGQDAGPLATAVLFGPWVTRDAQHDFERLSVSLGSLFCGDAQLENEPSRP